MLTVTEVWQARSTVNSYDKLRRCQIWISSRTLTTPLRFFMVFWTPRAKYQNSTPNHDMAASFQILSDKLFINYSTIEFYVILVNDIIINHPGRAPCKTPPERACCILCNMGSFHII